MCGMHEFADSRIVRKVSAILARVSAIGKKSVSRRLTTVSGGHQQARPLAEVQREIVVRTPVVEASQLIATSPSLTAPLRAGGVCKPVNRMAVGSGHRARSSQPGNAPVPPLMQVLLAVINILVHQIAPAGHATRRS